ncbi:MAG: pectate lyase, partial [Fibrobacter sp.]|nr:pectate lyase [Fibrobacter sp.]
IASSSSVIASETTQSSSSAAAATLTKHGAGSSSQCVDLGSEIVSFYYTIANATGATVTGLPDGVSGSLSGLDFTIAGTVSTNNTVGDYVYTITTTGGSTNATKSGTITVSESCNGTSSSSSEIASSSSTIRDDSSSSEVVSSSSTIRDDSSSSAEGTTAIAEMQFHQVNWNGPVQVFDMQGRFLGSVTPRTTEIGSVLRAKFGNSGVYLVRQGSYLLRVRVK